MAPGLGITREQAEEWRARVRSTFRLAVPCDWCGHTPSKQYAVVPAVYTKQRLVHRPHVGYACFDHALQFRFEAIGRENTAQLVNDRKEREAWRRADRRQEMRDNQTTLFDTPEPPKNPITEG